ncbi:hypothetical protein ABZV31_18090 [Streptomyces sp. NPDC005202]|uniref:hypothetical protein n=1 Tax=Streptomyces sp. NPDC005202 TaxID=3157021 RepID=UPI0033BD2D72
MSAQTDGLYGPLIPMPELTPDGLRTAVTRIAPSRIPALTQHLFEATTNAQQTQSLAPLRAFVHSWAVFVEIERHPQRAARLRSWSRSWTQENRTPPRPSPRYERSGRRPRLRPACDGPVNVTLREWKQATPDHFGHTPRTDPDPEQTVPVRLQC